ncbi:MULTISPECIES: hypothetical protein [Methylorubrum]|uniref:hypothetical protein n=1 Tax=Methylorubrum TaxID=2282523 RepID=UPI0010F87D41|nr:MULTISPECIES: hypothetical protein [Methylobacteriaceae]
MQIDFRYRDYSQAARSTMRDPEISHLDFDRFLVMIVQAAMDASGCYCSGNVPLRTNAFRTGIRWCSDRQRHSGQHWAHQREGIALGSVEILATTNLRD